MNSMGFEQAQHDAALYVYTKDKALIFVWVDDLIMVADSDLTESTDNTILTHFEGRDLGEVSWILGLEVVRDRSKRSETMTQRLSLIHISEPTRPY